MKQNGIEVFKLFWEACVCDVLSMNAPLWHDISMRKSIQNDKVSLFITLDRRSEGYCLEMKEDTRWSECSLVVW